jgi:hypothetical protein
LPANRTRGGGAARTPRRPRFGARRHPLAPGLDFQRARDESLGAACLLYGTRSKTERAIPSKRSALFVAYYLLSFGALSTRSRPRTSRRLGGCRGARDERWGTASSMTSNAGAALGRGPDGHRAGGAKNGLSRSADGRAYSMWAHVVTGGRAQASPSLHRPVETRKGAGGDRVSSPVHSCPLVHSPRIERNACDSSSLGRESASFS